MDMKTWTVATVPFDAMHNNGFMAQVRQTRTFKTITRRAVAILRRQKANHQPLHIDVYNHATEIIVVSTYQNKIRLSFQRDLMDSEAYYVLAALRSAIKVL